MKGVVETELKDELKNGMQCPSPPRLIYPILSPPVRRFLGRPALQFVTVLKDEVGTTPSTVMHASNAVQYLIEVPKSDDKRVPADWTLVSR